MQIWWPTQLSWNTNDENFVPKVLNVSLCCECASRHNSCHLIDLFLRQKLTFCARVYLYNMKSGIDIFESAALANVMKLFGFPFILHGWYQFRPWTIIGKSSWCIILEFESKHVITGWQSLLVKTFTTASDFRGNLGEEFLPTAHWCNELMIHDYS